MRIRTISPFRLLILLALFAILGYLSLFQTHLVSADPILEITKAATELNYNAVGNVIHYTIVATNRGDVLLSTVTVEDPSVTGLSCTPTNGSTLAPDVSMTCTATHTVTQADLNAGHYNNQACVDDGAGGAAQVCANKDVPAIQNRHLSLTKAATELNYNAVGNVIHYTIVATNDGNVTLNNVTVVDSKVTGLNCTPTNGSTLAPDVSMTCTATHTVTQADLNAGHYNNQACVNDGAGGASQVCANKDVLAIQNPHLSLTKVATEASFSTVGVALHYTLVATNDGNVTLIDVSIIDAMLGTLDCTPTQQATLAPLASLSCTGTYLTTQADVNAGKVDNTANASGMFNSTPVAALPASKSVPATQGPHLSLTKVATETSFSAVGVTLHYTLVATNDSNVTLTSVSIIDAMVGALTCTPAQPATLVPGANLGCTGTYLTTQADVNAGKVDNTANASGMLNSTPVLALPASMWVPATLSPALTIIKTATPAIYDHAGQMISYSFTIVNAGNVTISAPFTVFDDKATNEGCPLTPAKLDPGEFITCTASYTILFSDMTSGMVINSAYATGKFGETTITSNTATATITAKKILTYTFLPLVGKPYPSGVQVLPVSYSYESHNTLFIIGEVLNNTKDSVTSVEVPIYFFDAGGHFVFSESTYLWPFDLPAFEKGCFKFTLAVRDNWSYYQFQAPISLISGTSSGLAINNDSGLYITGSGNYEINGQVRNNGNQRSNSVSVGGTLYNGSGVPVGCEHTSIYSINLDPGQVSSFRKIEFLGYYRDYIDVTHYRLRVAGDLP